MPSPSMSATNADVFAKDPETEDGVQRWYGLMAACTARPSTLMAACGCGAVPSEADRLRCRIPASTAEFLEIQARLAELEER